MRGLSLVVASGGHSSSQCAGLSLSQPLLLRSTGSRRTGLAIVAHGPSRSAACGIFPDQGSNPCPLHWQADSQPLRHQGSPCFFYFNLCSLLLFVTTVAKRMLSIAIGIHNGLPWGTLPLCLKVKLKCLCSAHRETFWSCPSVNGCKKEEINTSPPWGWPSQEMFARLVAFLLYFLTSSPSLFHKRDWHSDLNNMVLSTLIRHLLGHPGFQIKSIFLASTPRLPIFWPVVQWAEQAWTL